MINCPKCRKPVELQHKNCSYCGESVMRTIAEKFDMLAESVENALRKELEARKKRIRSL